MINYSKKVVKKMYKSEQFGDLSLHTSLMSKLENLVQIRLVLNPLKDGILSNKFPEKFREKLIDIAKQYLGKIDENDLKIMSVSFPKKDNKYFFSNELKIYKSHNYSIEIKFSSSLLNKFFVEHFILQSHDIIVKVEEIEFYIKKIEFSKPINKIEVFRKIVNNNSKIQIFVNYKTPTISPLIRYGKVFRLIDLLEDPVRLLSSYLFPEEKEKAYKEIIDLLDTSIIHAISLNSININGKIGIYGKIIYVTDSFSELAYLLLLLEYLGYGEERENGCGVLNIVIRPFVNQSEDLNHIFKDD